MVAGSSKKGFVLTVQSTHAIAERPHALAELPGWHAPLLQQPPLHGCCVLQMGQAWTALCSRSADLRH